MTSSKYIRREAKRRSKIRAMPKHGTALKNPLFLPRTKVKINMDTITEKAHLVELEITDIEDGFFDLDKKSQKEARVKLTQLELKLSRLRKLQKGG